MPAGTFLLPDGGLQGSHVLGGNKHPVLGLEDSQSYEGGRRKEDKGKDEEVSTYHASN